MAFGEGSGIAMIADIDTIFSTHTKLTPGYRLVALSIISIDIFIDFNGIIQRLIV